MPEGLLQRLSFRLCIDLSLGEPCRVIASSTISASSPYFGPLLSSSSQPQPQCASRSFQ